MPKDISGGSCASMWLKHLEFYANRPVIGLSFTCNLSYPAKDDGLQHTDEGICWHTEAETKWPSFHRRHLQVHFFLWFNNFHSHFTEICSLGSNWQYGNIGSDNGLAPNRWQAIFWTNVVVLYWLIYVSIDLHELKHQGINKMVNILQTFSNVFPWKYSLDCWIQCPLYLFVFFHEPIEKKSSLVHVMAWCWISTKLLPWAITITLWPSDVIWRQGSLGQHWLR